MLPLEGAKPRPQQQARPLIRAPRPDRLSRPRSRRAGSLCLAATLSLLLNACVPAPPPGPGPAPEVASRARIAESTLPPMKRFAAPRPAPPARANADLAQDFLELSFQLESGRRLPHLTRFEGPISLRVTGAPSATLMPDLRDLLVRLRREAGIPIALTGSPGASITLEAVPRARIKQVLPGAACFVAPNVSSLADYARARHQPRTDWTALPRRDRIAIFLPNDSSPQEVRDCLHEELAQALGPLNDLYRLPDSVFNDDNVHTVLTGFDMLMLRLTYDPALASGMSRAEVAARLPALLRRHNPRGEGLSPAPGGPTPAPWNGALQAALGGEASLPERARAADRALQLAAAGGWTDHRRALSHYVLGRALQGRDPAAAQAQYLAADRYFASRPETALHRAYVGTRLAAFALTRGDGAAALALTAPHLESARDSENAALLATLLLLRAEALEQLGRDEEARSVRLDSIGWARYGFGSEWAVRAKLEEIASLNPQKG